ncbi:MFS transporter [Candidatus Woesearchaeota archaeon]|nr:MFS transporter [Candidatus Woesearchaeota archaeon]
MQKKKTDAKNVIWLGIVSLLTDISSEMLFPIIPPIIPLFLTVVLKANMAIIGFIEGIAEGLSAFLKLIAGIVSDRFKHKKLLTIIGYSSSALSKPFLALATIWPHVLIVRILDRIGKGIRTTPRDALIAASVKDSERGKYFGLHRTMDSVGAVVGVLIVTALLFYLGESEASFRTVFWISFIPAALAVVLLFLFVHDVETKAETKKQKPFNLFKVWKRLNRDLKKFYMIMLLFNAASFSYAFFILRAQNVGFAIKLIPILYLVYNIFYAFSAYPAGKISDHFGRNTVLAAGFLLFAVTSLGFGFFANDSTLWILFAMYGVFIGLTDGVARAVVADLSTEKDSGTAFGVYHMLVGLTIFPANMIGGLLWKYVSPTAPFVYAAVLALLATAAILLFHNREKVKAVKMTMQNFKAYR